jgi:hypothetical protein
LQKKSLRFILVLKSTETTNLHMSTGSLPKFLLLLIFSLWLAVSAHSQDSSLFNRILSFPDKVFGRIDKEANKYEQKLTQQTEKYLNKLERQEQKLKRKLWRTDSTKAKEVFGDVKGRYDGLRQGLKGEGLKVEGNTSTVYNGHLDSLGTAMNFLQNNPQLQHATAIKDKLSTNVKSIADLKSKLNQTENIRKQIQQRQQQLKQHLQNTPLAKEFRKFKKEVYYYQAQVKEYQDALKDPKKLGAKMLQVANKVPAFQDFFRRNSELASLFRLPGGTDPVNNTASFAGLQTRADVQGMLQQRLGTGANAQQYFQQQMQGAQAQMQDLKNKLQQYKQGSYGNGDGEMPDFKVNDQKTKSFLQRIEWGSNMQTTKGNLYFPVTSDIGLSAGYKLNDKSIIGIGASYKVGLGKGWQNISITHQGAGLRTFVDIKLKGSFWISGGGELNYRNEFRRIDVLRDMNAWQQSALLGISKKYKAGKKFKGNAQLLYDFLWKQQTPRTQAVVFRVGYNF